MGLEGPKTVILMKYLVTELREECLKRGLRMARVKPELVKQLAPQMCLSGHTASRVAEMLGWAARPPLSTVMGDGTARAWIAQVWNDDGPRLRRGRTK